MRIGAPVREEALCGPSPVLPISAVKHRDGIDHDFANRPGHLHWAAFGFDRALVLAIQELAFEKHMAAGLDFGRVLGSRTVADAGVPLRFLLPISIRIFVAFGSGDRKLRHAPTVLSSGGACILSGVSRESDAIDIHKIFPF